MKLIALCVLVSAVTLFGCGTDDQKLTPAQEQARKDEFKKGPDYSQLTPEQKAGMEKAGFGAKIPGNASGSDSFVPPSSKITTPKGK